MMLTAASLMTREKDLQSKIQTNLGPNACRVYYIQEEDVEKTGGLVKDAVAKVVIREMRVSSRRPPNHVNYQEHIDRVYIWSDKQTTKIPYPYEDIINEWLSKSLVI